MAMPAMAIRGRSFRALLFWQPMDNTISSTGIAKNIFLIADIL